jgi:hypothetical protein
MSMASICDFEVKVEADGETKLEAEGEDMPDTQRSTCSCCHGCLGALRCGKKHVASDEENMVHKESDAHSRFLRKKRVVGVRLLQCEWG